MPRMQTCLEGRHASRADMPRVQRCLKCRDPELDTPSEVFQVDTSNEVTQARVMDAPLRPAIKGRAVGMGDRPEPHQGGPERVPSERPSHVIHQRIVAAHASPRRDPGGGFVVSKALVAALVPVGPQRRGRLSVAVGPQRRGRPAAPRSARSVAVGSASRSTQRRGSSTILPWTSPLSASSWARAACSSGSTSATSIMTSPSSTSSSIRAR